MESINMDELTVFKLTENEIRNFYVKLALIHHGFLRKPNLNEDKAIEQSIADLKRFTSWANQLADKDPNNLMLYKIRNFFEQHYKLILEINTTQIK